MSRFEGDKSFHTKSQDKHRHKTKQRYSGEDTSNAFMFDKGKGMESISMILSTLLCLIKVKVVSPYGPVVLDVVKA